MAYLVKTQPPTKHEPLFTREEVISHIVNAKDFDLTVCSPSGLHLPLVAVNCEVARFQKSYHLCKRDKKNKITRMDEYLVTVDLPLGLLSEEMKPHIFLRPYAKDMNEIINVEFAGIRGALF